MNARTDAAVRAGAQDRRDGDRFLGLLCVAIFVAVGLLATETVQYSRNSLLRNGRWVSSKLMMQTGLMGSVYFWFTRNAVARNQLNLGAWHGFNETSLNRMFRPGTVEFRFRLDPLAHVSFLFNRDEAGYDGLRFSRHPRFPSMFLHATRAGAFLRITPLATPALGEGWHRLRADFRDGAIEVLLDGTSLGRFVTQNRVRQFIGFRGGLAAAAIDDVQVVGAGGLQIASESFRNQRGYGTAIALLALATAALVAAWPMTVRALRRGGNATRPRRVLLGLAAIGLGVLVSLAIYAWFDFFYWSRLYPFPVLTPDSVRPARMLASVEHLRARLFFAGVDPNAIWDVAQTMPAPAEDLRRSITTWTLVDPPLRSSPEHFRVFDDESGTRSRVIANEAVTGFPGKGRHTLRVGFLGTSQTFGVGAEDLSGTFVSRVHHSLVARLPEPFRAETFNFAISGSTSHELVRRFRDHWTRLNLDLLVVNLAFNDPAPGVLAAELEALVRLARAGGTETVLLLEPASPEMSPSDVRHLADNHHAVLQAGARTGAPVLDLHGFLSAAPQYDSGFLWWDKVHLTSYGQSLVKAWLSERLRWPVERAIRRSRGSE